MGFPPVGERHLLTALPRRTGWHFGKIMNDFQVMAARPDLIFLMLSISSVGIMLTPSRISNISKNDARGLYFAYHEGNGGYKNGTYREKQWLLDAGASSSI